LLTQVLLNLSMRFLSNFYHTSTFREVPSSHPVLYESFNLFAIESEIVKIRVSQYRIIQSIYSHEQFSHKTADNTNSYWALRVVLSNVIDGNRSCVFLTSCRSNYPIVKYLSQLVQSKSFSERVPALLSDSCGLNFVSNQLFPLVFKVLKSAHLLKNALFVFAGGFTRHNLDYFFEILDSSLLG